VTETRAEAVQRLGVQHKLAAFRLGGRGRHRHFAAELVRGSRFAFADAFDLRSVQRINLRATLPVILETNPHRQSEQVGEAFLERLIASDLRRISRITRPPDTQKSQLTPGPLELVRMGVTPDLDCSAFGDAPIALSQRHMMAARQINQFFQCAMTQPRIGQMRDRFGLYRGVDRHPFEIAGCQRSRLVRYRHAFLD